MGRAEISGRHRPFDLVGSGRSLGWFTATFGRQAEDEGAIAQGLAEQVRSDGIRGGGRIAGRGDAVGRRVAVDQLVEGRVVRLGGQRDEMRGYPLPHRRPAQEGASRRVEKRSPEADGLPILDASPLGDAGRRGARSTREFLVVSSIVWPVGYLPYVMALGGGDTPQIAR